RMVKAATIMMFAAGCGWRAYGRMAATHADVLVAVARKGVDLVAGGRLTAESMPEVTYPLERAQAFAGDVASGGGAPPSLEAFQTLCARYRDLLDTLDRVRREERGEAAREALAAPLGEVERAAAAVHAALVTEGW